MIKAVIFDVDGVLIDSFKANYKFYCDLLIYTGYKPPGKPLFKKMCHLTMKDVIKKVTKLTDDGEINKIWLMGKKRVVRYPEELLTASPDIDEVLKKLTKKYLLAIVTSRIRGGVFSLPQLKKYRKLFIVNVYYEDTKKHKPSPDPLLLALKQLSVLPHEAVYVGDAQSDVIAAKKAGIKSLIYKGRNIKGADVRTTAFDKIPELIKNLH